MLTYKIPKYLIIGSFGPLGFWLDYIIGTLRGVGGGGVGGLNAHNKDLIRT